MKQKFHKIIGAASLLLLGLASMANAAHEAVDLSGLTENFTASDGDVLTGKLGNNLKISIAAGASVTLNGVDINGDGAWNSGSYAGITCEGNCKIILADGSKNVVKGFDAFSPGIYIPQTYTLTIDGKGSLDVRGNLDEELGDSYGAGIGCGYGEACGNIEINNGIIIAEGRTHSAGIGGSYSATCGDITINGGSVEVVGDAAGIGSGNCNGSCGKITINGGNIKAQGGYRSAGIGLGYIYNYCNNSLTCKSITISDKAQVTAISGDEALHSIGIGSTHSGAEASVGSITIGGKETGYIITSPFTYPSLFYVSEGIADGKKAAIIDGSYTGTDALEIDDDIEVDAVVFNRTFSTNGNGYSTITLPFSIAGNKLEGVDAILQFVGMGKDAKGNDEAHVSYVWCSEAQAAADAKCASASGELEAYTPYLVKVAAEKIGFKSGGSKITLQSTKGVVPETRVNTADGDYVLRGTLAKKSWSKGDPELGYVWGYAATDEYVNVGDFVKAGPGAWINPLRAYVAFEPAKPKSVAAFKNASASKAAPQAVIASGSNTPDVIPIVIVDPNENGGEHTTAIGMFDTRTGKIHLNNESSRTFDLKGRSVGKPTAKGIYLKNNQTFKF